MFFSLQTDSLEFLARKGGEIVLIRVNRESYILHFCHFVLLPLLHDIYLKNNVYYVKQFP